MNTFWDNYPSIKKDMEKVEEILKENVRCREAVIEETLLELIASGGKMLRPAFVIMAAHFGKSRKKIYTLAAVMELLHMATLVHDDIIDCSELRRGKKTIQAKYGQSYAVFIGDFLFTRCFKLLSDDTSVKNMKSISDVISRICIGEIEQFSAYYDMEFSPRRYLRRISAKTAALFALSFYIGAAESGCSKDYIKKLARIGYDIGMAFQIIDDILDYEGSEELLGKPQGNDLKQGNFTIPLIYAMKTGNAELESLVSRKDYTEEEIRTIIRLVKECGGLERAKSLAAKYTDRAFAVIDQLNASENREVLREVTQRLLVRNI